MSKKKKKKYKYNTGDVVYLKKQEDILYTYDKELKKLIDTNHRFAIITYSEDYSYSIVVLLSTSKYLNEYNEMGLLLKGNYNKYGNGKNLYIISVFTNLDKYLHSAIFKPSSSLNSNKIFLQSSSVV